MTRSAIDVSPMNSECQTRWRTKLPSCGRQAKQSFKESRALWTRTAINPKCQPRSGTTF